jgi:choline dehydrogenase-like flavoprotein
VADPTGHLAAHAVVQQPAAPSVRYRPTDEVDFVIVGAGSAGGIVARELSVAGFRVVVLEQGPYLRERDFRHDELAVSRLAALTNDHRVSPNTFRETPKDTATRRPSIGYGRVVGGGSVHFTGNYWRFHEIDFIERSKRGAIAGTGFADWPITYADLEPYYTRVEWEIGVSGQVGTNPFEPPHSRPYPLPPLPPKSIGVLTDRAAKKLGWHAYPAPMAILSGAYRGRSACVQCGFCETFGCEVRAKSSTLATMIPDAERTGRCEIRPSSYVRRVEVDKRGRVTGVTYFDSAKREVMQRAKAVVLCANGAETPRLLLMSTSSQFPNGLANSSGLVGKYIMFNGGTFSGGLFEHEVNGYRGVVVTRVIQDFYELDAKLGMVGGGGMDMRFDVYPMSFAIFGLGLDAPTWGADYKRMLREYFNRTAYVFGHTTSLPVESNSISLDPELKDAWGMPAIRLTFKDHPNDLKVYQFFLDRSLELLDAAGATKRWGYPSDAVSLPAVHLLGTCRMGDDPRTSVVNKFHRAHDVPNLFLVDGSSFVTGGRGQPTMTIQALAFRAAEHMAASARRGELGS